jgi:hypothetical protein
MKVFWSYFTLHHSQYFDPVMMEILPLELRELPKEQFFVEFMSVIRASIPPITPSSFSE